MTARRSILVTNDDGFHAPGIKALAEALSSIGEVAVVAPDRERSGVARMINLGRPLRVRSRGPLRWTVDGSPTDCTYLALHELLSRPPDLVVSGINRGPNLADDVTYSGTVAGAMEGALLGFKAFAISLDGWPPKHYGPAAEVAVAVAELMLARDWPRHTMLNVNVPDTDGAPLSGFRWTRAGLRDYGHTVTVRHDPRGRPYYWLGGDRLGHYPLDGSDCDAVAEGLVSITPLDLDLTHEKLLASLSSVELSGLERR